VEDALAGLVGSIHAELTASSIDSSVGSMSKKFPL
jgi:hypothetical protein